MLTADGIRQVLADYVEFPGADSAVGAAAAGAAGTPGPGAASLPSSQPSGLRKGMTRAEVAAALGEPESCTERAEGALTVTTCHYRATEARVEGQFVDGVLLRYTISSQ